MEVDYRIKANSSTYRDGNVDAGKIPAAGDQPAVEERRILAVHFEQQFQLVLNGKFTSDLVSPEAAHGDAVGRIECQPAHVDYREVAEQQRRVQWHQGERAYDRIKRADGAVASFKAPALKRAAFEQTVRVDLVERNWRGAHLEDGVEAHLTVHRDSCFDVGERRRSRHQAAVEMLHLVTTHLEIKGELLLERELAAEFVGATSGDNGVGSANRHEPVHVRDRVGVKQAIETSRREGERSLDRHGDHDRAKTRWKASLLEGAVLVQPVKGAGLGAGRGAPCNYFKKEQRRAGKIPDRWQEIAW